MVKISSSLSQETQLQPMFVLLRRRHRFSPFFHGQQLDSQGGYRLA